MSTGLNCSFFKTSGSWYYLLEDGDAPKMAWDWREFATAYGPFDSQEQAREHLRANHANPGGYSTFDYDGEGEQPDGVLAKLIVEAQS